MAENSLTAQLNAEIISKAQHKRGEFAGANAPKMRAKAAAKRAAPQSRAKTTSRRAGGAMTAIWDRNASARPVARAKKVLKRTNAKKAKR